MCFFDVKLSLQLSPFRIHSIVLQYRALTYSICLSRFHSQNNFIRGPLQQRESLKNRIGPSTYLGQIIFTKIAFAWAEDDDDDDDDTLCR